jgi:hypothetical protein
VTKYLREIHLKKENFILIHGFEVFSPWSLASIAFRPVAKQKHHDGRAYIEEQSCSPHGSQKAERKNGSRGKVYPSKTRTRDLLPLTGPIS